MYSMLMIILIGIGLWMVILGSQRRRWTLLGSGALLAIGTAVFFWFMGFWGEMLWFEALGYQDRFWDVFLVRIGAGATGAACAAGLLLLLTFHPGGSKQPLRLPAIILGAAVGLQWGNSNWELILRYFYAVPTELQEPIFNKTVGFYLFTLPFLDALKGLVLLLLLVGLAAIAADVYLKYEKGGDFSLTSRVDAKRVAAFYRAVGSILLVLAFGKYLERFHLMYSELGAITGPGWTDVHIRLPGIGALIVALVAAAVVLLVPFLRNRIIGLLGGSHENTPLAHLRVFGVIGMVLIGLQLVLLSLVPALFQRLRVEPNEITFEKPYIAHNIRMTRHGFRLHEVEEREYPAKKRFTPEMVEQNRAIFDNIRLWDWRALDAVYKQFQEIRLYYEFDDVDVDRYHIGDDYRQVMVSAREMELDNLPEQSQTFVNRRFKYTHGYGITMTNVSEFTEQGLPDLLIRDIPPISSHPALQVDRPELYYGELTRTPVLVNTSEEEFDYPRGEGNAYVRYSGSGGVRLSSLWRKFLYGWKYDGLQLFLSGYPTRDSRIMFHRQVKERAATLAPFLKYDDDPYVVLAEGRLYWIIDAYTTSSFYPYAERFVPESGISPVGAPETLYGEQALGWFAGSNYVRNSVKVVVDAYEGSVDFYVFDDEDPLIRTWQRIFPELFKPREKMPEALQAHVRYPVDMLELQGLVYAKYHMNDPTVFYNQEDLWVRATEKYYNRVQPVEPYYIMWELPASDHPEFVLMLPFTPKNRQVSIGWIAGMCDGDNYGRFLAYKFPKKRRVLGPQQVETKIDQDRFLSGQLTLWDQRGSRVIRGNVLAIPVEETLIYVEPIYLQAETAAYPELRLVAMMHNDNLSYAESFDKALQGLFGDDAPAKSALGKGAVIEGSLSELIDGADEAFNTYLQALGEKRYQQAASALHELETILQKLSSSQREASR